MILWLRVIITWGAVLKDRSLRQLRTTALECHSDLTYDTPEKLYEVKSGCKSKFCVYMDICCLLRTFPFLVSSLSLFFSSQLRQACDTLGEGWGWKWLPLALASLPLLGVCFSALASPLLPLKFRVWVLWALPPLSLHILLRIQMSQDSFVLTTHHTAPFVTTCPQGCHAHSGISLVAQVEAPNPLLAQSSCHQIAGTRLT